MKIVLILLLLLAVLILALCFYFALVATGRKDFSEERQIWFETEYHKMDRELFEQPYERWERSNPQGKRLVARFFEGASTERIMLVNHGYHASCISMYKYLSMLQELGFSVLMPDHQAHGESEGRFITYGALESEDCIDWLKELKSRYPQARLSVLGESMGGAITLLIAEKYPELDFAVADCPYSDCREILRYTGKRSYHFPDFLLPLVAVFFRLLCGCSMKEASPISHLHQLNVATLLVHGDADKVVPVTMSREMAAMNENICYWELAGQPHAHVVVDYGQEYKEKIAELMSRSEVKL